MSSSKMGKTRRDSISGQMKKIGSTLKDWRKKSLVGLGFYSKKDRKQKKAPKKRDEMDDIEILEQIVHEQVDFDWDKFQEQREHSMFIKNEEAAKLTGEILAKRSSIHTGAPLTMNKFEEIRITDVSKDIKNLKPKKLVAVKLATEEESGKFSASVSNGKVVAEEDDSESVATAIIDLAADDPLNNITGEGKEKLKFINEFAKKEPERPSIAAQPSVGRDPASALRRSYKTNRRSRSKQFQYGRSSSRTNASVRLSRGSRQKRSTVLETNPNSSRLSRSSNSAPPAKNEHEQLEQVLKRNIRRTRTNKEKMLQEEESRQLADQFARYKGFKDTKHMQEHLERLRGFEELRNETQIDLMARENGYNPGRGNRITSVLSFLDGKDNAFDVNEDNDESDLEEEDNEDFTDGESLEGDYEELNNFMDSTGDDLGELAKKWDKVEGFANDFASDDEDLDKIGFSEQSENLKNPSKIERARRKEQRRKRAIRRGWERTKDQAPNEVVFRKIKPTDSLTMKHLEGVKF